MHDLVIIHALDLLQLGLQGGHFQSGFVHLALDIDEDALLRLARILDALGVEVVDLALDADLAHQVAEFIRLPALLRHLVLELHEGSGHPALLLVDALLLVLDGDRVGQIGRFLTILVQDGNLDEVGVAHLGYGEHPAQFHVGYLLGRRFPLLLELHRVDHRIEDLLALDDLELRGGETGVHPPVRATVEDLHVVVILLDLHGHRGLVLARGQIGSHTGSDNHEQENKDDQRQTDPDDPPVIKQMKLDLARVRLHGVLRVLHEILK